MMEWAALAQLVEHRFCKPTVAGSNPVSSSTNKTGAWFPSGQREQTVNLPEYSFEGSNPSRATILDEMTKLAGVAQLVEHKPSKLGVEGSSPFARSIFFSI